MDSHDTCLGFVIGFFRILQYVPYIIIAVVVTAVWGAKTLTRGRNLAKTITQKKAHSIFRFQNPTFFFDEGFSDRCIP